MMVVGVSGRRGPRSAGGAAALALAGLLLALLPAAQHSGHAAASPQCKLLDHPSGAYQWLAPGANRQMGLAYRGNPARLRAALQRYRQGKQLIVTFVGGSITGGQGALDTSSYPAWTSNVLKYVLPGANGTAGKEGVRIRNGGMPGVSSLYHARCHNVHVDPQSDVVVVEYAINDDELSLPHMGNPQRRTFEKLIRTLLNYPNRPAVVLLHAFRWFGLGDHGTLTPFWRNAERQQNELAWYYGLSAISVKACCFHLMRVGLEGFQVNATRSLGGVPRPAEEDALLKGKAFYYDEIHPEGHTGHRVMGELVASLIMDTYQAMMMVQPFTKDDQAIADAPLPAPMMPGNWEPVGPRCYVAEHFNDVITMDPPGSWNYIDIYGKMLISDRPGSTLRITLNTTSPAHVLGDVVAELGYFEKPEPMGMARVTCEHCVCAEAVLHGQAEMDEQGRGRIGTKLHTFSVSQHPTCIIAVTVLQGNQTSPSTTFILNSVLVAMEPQDPPFGNYGAIQYAGEVCSRDPGRIYEVMRTHWQI